MMDRVAAYFGARGQGKSTQAKHYLASARPARLLIFDPMHEYATHGAACSSLAELNARARSAPSFALRYLPPRGTEKQTQARFDVFCSIAYDLGNLTMLCEELQLVTRASWAPPAWSDCTLRGRHKGISILGLSQRPASVDKNFLSNCSTVSTCRLNFAEDIQCMAQMLGVSRERVRDLLPFTFLVRDMVSGTVTAGDTGGMLTGSKIARPRVQRKK